MFLAALAVFLVSTSAKAEGPLHVNVSMNTNTVTITWTKLTDANVVKYKVNRITQGGNNATSTACDNLTEASCTDSNVPDGIYVYNVIANNAAGQNHASEAANPVTISTNNSGGGGGGSTSTGVTCNEETLFPGVKCNNFQGWVEALMKWIMYTIGPAILVLLTVYSGFRYISSNGSEQVIKEAKDLLLGAIVGYVLLLLVGAIMKLIF